MNTFERCFSIDELEDRLTEMKGRLTQGFRERRKNDRGEFIEPIWAYRANEETWKTCLSALSDALQRHIELRRKAEAH